MFVGREEELSELEALYASGAFELMVLYGRRRVGKTALLEKFSEGKSPLLFTAQLQADADNLRDFSRAVVHRFGLPETTPPFASWLDALQFVAQKAVNEKLVFVFDEFPYAARANAGLASALQIAVDRDFAKTDCLLVLCGSNQGFMENEVLAEKSPLYGRRTAQLKLRPFDYWDASRMLPDCSDEDKLSYYASLGGTPYYLAAIDCSKTYIENITNLFFKRTGLMFDEPSMLMRQELREPAMYASVMRAIAAGANRPSEIADRVKVPATSLSVYLKSLVDLDLIERKVPLGDSLRSKKSIYSIKDPAFAFWYRFVAPYTSAIESGLGQSVAERLLASDRRYEFEGHVFERACREWVVRQARKGELPLAPTAVGSWWGTDPVAHEQADIDVLAADDIDHELLVGECKWRNRFDEGDALDKLASRAELVRGYRSRCLYLFVKKPLASAAMKKCDEAHVTVVTAEQMYAGLPPRS